MCKVNASNISVVVELPWPNLRWLGLGKHKLILGFNNIGNNGAKMLSKADMPHLKRIINITE